MLLASILITLAFIYRNGLLPHRAVPRAAVIQTATKLLDENPSVKDLPMVIKVELSQQMEVKAGQYVKLWMPTLGLFAWLKTYPCVVTSWSPGKQGTLEFLVRGHRGLTRVLRKQLTHSFPAYVIGPHGFSASVSDYESILVVASGIGIAAVIPYLKQLLYGYNTAAFCVRRVHFVWEMEGRGMPLLLMQDQANSCEDLSVVAQPWLNELLLDDVLSADDEPVAGDDSNRTEINSTKVKKGYVSCPIY
jgi:predicted ferric reductase